MHRDGDRQRAARQRRVEKRADDGRGAEQRPHGGEQLHVAGAGRAEQMARQHERQANKKSKGGRAHREVADAGDGEPETAQREQAGQRVRHAARLEIDERRGSHARRQRPDHDEVR